MNKYESEKYEIIVDDLVAANPVYSLVATGLANGANPILRNHNLIEACVRDTPDASRCQEFASAEKDLCTRGWDNYSQYRESANMQSNSMLLENALITGKSKNKTPIHEVIYETTGSNGAYDWMVNVAKLAKAAGMRVHLVYPVVSLNKLKKRALSRAVGSPGKEGNGRLPCAWAIEQIFHEAAQNFVKLVGNSEDSVHFDTILVTDNDAEGRNAMKEVMFYERSAKCPTLALSDVLPVMEQLMSEGKWPGPWLN